MPHNNRNPAGASRGASEKGHSDRTTVSEVAKIVIPVEPTDRHGRFRARLDGRVIIESTRQPLLDTARTLVVESFDPNAIFEMRHAGADHVALRAPLWAAARLHVKDGKFVKHRSCADDPAKADAGLAHATYSPRRA
jgi:hypothetical protein